MGSAKQSLLILVMCLAWTTAKLNNYCSLCDNHTMCKYQVMLFYSINNYLPKQSIFKKGINVIVGGRLPMQGCRWFGSFG